ncbi:acyl-CoA dehydrogenase family protein [Qipengyuania sp. DGS5-3]|uniref:acyl-CoA dehydrogenase family protein n=1 Tax=Qipengyuania sp. DGS5-3 TaxID=3349632 RepID=UPI0036D433A1
MSQINFPEPVESAAAEELRAEVRDFLAREMASETPVRKARSWDGFDADFSRKLGAKGWLGMTWPKQYGGQERSAFERYVVVEELLAAGAPVSAHWIAERQSGPLLLNVGTEAQRRAILPKIAAGECVFCIGMSEPDSGSDLAATRTRAESTDGGYRINGTKLWTTNAHRADYMILFCRTSGGVEQRQAGTSQLLIDLKNTDGITIRPIRDLAGQEHFNEVNFEDAFVPADTLIGEEGNGWNQVMSELAFERSGPERFLSSFELVVQLTRILAGSSDPHALAALGRMAAHIAVLRRLSRGVAAMLEAGEDPALQASIIKDLGAVLEQDIPAIARELVTFAPRNEAKQDFLAVLDHLVMVSPSFSLRGGTREILRGIIARGLGLR